MNRKHWGRLVWALVIASFLPIMVYSQPPEKLEARTDCSAQEIVTLKDKAGQITTSSESKPINDLSLLEPRFFINLNLVIMEVTKSATDILSSSNIRALDGFPANLVMGGGPQFKELSFQISIIPHVIEAKGIDLKVQYKIGPQMKAPVDKSLLVGNSESAVIELMENESKESKLMLKITPLISKIGPIEAYPEEIKTLKLENSILTMNDDLVIAKGSLRAESDKDEIYIYFSVRGRGLYVISFKPFKGAEKMAVVSDNVLRMKSGEDYFEWTSSEIILSKGKWPAWVRRNPKFDNAGKTGGLLTTKNGFAGIITGTENVLKIFFGEK
jgi:hypothetical protein